MFVVDSKCGTIPFCMICHPKTGSQSMQKVLRESFKARPVRGLHFINPDECERIRNEGGIVASTVRNPWDLMVSWYCYTMLQAHNSQYPEVEPFKSWLLRTLEAGNGWIEKGLFFGVEQCNRIFRFEHDLEFQLNNCLQDCLLPPVKLPHIAKTEHTHYSNYYDCETSVAVALRFPEVQEWGYKYEMD